MIPELFSIIDRNGNWGVERMCCVFLGIIGKKPQMRENFATNN